MSRCLFPFTHKYLPHLFICRKRHLITSDIYFAVVLYSFAIFEDFFHNGCLIGTVVKFYFHFLCHKSYNGFTNAVGLLSGFLHLCGTVCTIDFYIVCFFHNNNPFFGCSLSEQLMSQKPTALADFIALRGKIEELCPEVYQGTGK